MASVLLKPSGAETRLATNSRSAAILLERLAMIRCPAQQGLDGTQAWLQAVAEVTSRPDEAAPENSCVYWSVSVRSGTESYTVNQRGWAAQPVNAHEQLNSAFSQEDFACNGLAQGSPELILLRWTSTSPSVDVLMLPWTLQSTAIQEAGACVQLGRESERGPSFHLSRGSCKPQRWPQLTFNCVTGTGTPTSSIVQCRCSLLLPAFSTPLNSAHAKAYRADSGAAEHTESSNT